MQNRDAPSSAPTPLLDFSVVGVTYPQAATPAPRAASLSVEPGEVVLLLGPSGCGKSSLSLTVNALVPRSVPARVAGTLRVHGRAVAELSVAELSCEVGMVFQDVDAQIVMNTVFDEVAFGPENLCLPVPEVLDRTEQALRWMGLWERRDDDPVELSGGQKQRLAIACALALGVSLMVLDEPTANLDPAGIETVYEAIREFTADDDHAVLLIEHNVDAALPVVDRVVVLDRAGATLFDGSPAEVFTTHGAEVAALGIRVPAPTKLGLALRENGRSVPVLPVATADLRELVASGGTSPGALTCTDRLHRPFQPLPPRAGPSAVAVELDGVSVVRGHRIVLEAATLTIGRGEFVGVVGVNGSGKTTLLQTIAGLIRPTEGTVRILDNDPRSRQHRRKHRGRVGYVFQNPEHQFVADTVADELVVSLARAELTSAEKDELIERELERFGLLDARDRHPFLLSGGQKRRLSVATALIEGAEVLLLDEPTFGQDQAYTDELVGLLRDLHDTGTTIVVIAHDLDLIAEHTQRTIVLADGRLCGAGPTAEVFADSGLLERAGLQPPAMCALLRDLGLSTEQTGRERS